MYKHKERKTKFETDDFDEADHQRKIDNIVKTYPSIPFVPEFSGNVLVFDKLDGSNIRAEWQRKKGWYKLGTRNRLLDETDPIFGRVPKMLNEREGKLLEETLIKLKFDRVMCFFELHGPNSFAGMHNADDDMRLTLIDVAPFKQGIMEPYEFVKKFGHLDIPKILYDGHFECNDHTVNELLTQVRESTLEGMTLEGVVIKAPNTKKTKMPIMFKYKSKAWLDKLHNYCGNNKELFRALM